MSDDAKPRKLLSSFLALSTGFGCIATQAQELPVPCGGAACGANGPAVWVTSGEATGSVVGNTFNIRQTSDNATLNWASFNVGADGVVNFDQPDSSSVALNQIFQGDPTRIFGSLNANGQVYLLNQNGIIFGESAVVNVGGLVASSLELTPEALQNGIAGASRDNAAAFALFTDSSGNELPSGAVTVENGAFLGAEGGQVFLFAPEVANRGSIETPDGQTILAAGSKIYLAVSADPNLRGLLVEVDGDGAVTNGDENNATSAAEAIAGQIVAERGNVSLAGFAVNQLGRVSATTSIRQNGSIRLVAQRDVTVQANNEGVVDLLPAEAGSVVLGPGSVTEVTLDSDTESRTVDVNEQPQSVVDIGGRTIDVFEDAQIVAPSGSVTLTARENPQIVPAIFNKDPNETRVYIADGASIDVSGASVSRPIQDNIVEVELRGNQLRDSPQQRESDIRGQSVLVDIRQSGTRADGSAWQGTPLADASGEISNVERSVSERNLAGGRISLNAEGAVIVEEGVVFDISGGQIEYSGGNVATSRLLGADGRIYDIADANRDRDYVQVADAFVVEHPKWGVTEVFSGFRRDDSGTFEPGYIEGKDAGSIEILAPRFVFDGHVDAEVAVGRYQRLPGNSVADDALYRPFDEIPFGGQLTVGSTSGGSGALPRFTLGSIEFAPGSVLGELQGPSGLSFNPLSDLLPTDFASRLRPELFGLGAITRGRVFVNDSIVYPVDASISLPVGGELLLTGSRIDFAGQFSAPSGRLELLARRTELDLDQQSLDVGSAAAIDLAGYWVNDNPLTGGGQDAIAIDGGFLSIATNDGALNIQPGSLIDVSGGAQRRVDGTVISGLGGAVSLSAESGAAGDPVAVTIGADVQGFSLTDGASLAISANSICVSAADCSRSLDELWVSPEVFADDGFGDISLTANLIGLEVDAGTQIVAQQRNFLLQGDVSTIATGTPLSTFARTALLPVIDRRPVDVTLRSQTASNTTIDFDAFDSVPGLLLGRDSRVDLDPLASASLESNTLLVVDGSVSAPAGNIQLSVSNELLEPLGVETLPTSGLWLGDGANLDASGVALLRADELGRLRGSVLGGGNVSLVSRLEGIALANGARINVSGAAADLDVLAGSATNPRFERQRIGSAAGSVAMTAAEYVLVNGSISALPGDDSGQAGGRFSLTIDGNLRGADPGGVTSEPVLSLDPRRIIVENSSEPLLLAVGAPIPASLQGAAVISGETIESAGFDDVSLRAGSLISFRQGNRFLASVGDIEFRGGLNLNLAGTLSLDAANVSGGSGDVSITANVLRMGHNNADDLVQGFVGEPADEQIGQLSVQARLIELLGNLRLRGFESATLSSGGDIRASGVQAFGTRELQGSLRTFADLNLNAAQVYPTTLSNYAVTVEREGGTLLVTNSGNTPDLVLSAGGSLALSASNVSQQGRLIAPFGELALSGEVIDFADGSLTSTSLGDTLTPFGALQAGAQWTYDLDRGETLVFDGEVNDLPQPTVRVAGNSVTLGDGAIVDVSGGGDLLAYEFIPGVGGSSDYLSAEVSPNLFAILPGESLQFAPVDLAETRGFDLQVGDAVALEGFGDLPAGTYTLLPPRYAVLPGAVLISPVEGYQDILPDEVFRGTDGSLIVSGRRVIQGAETQSARRQGFSLLPRSRAFEEADYTLTLASDFFAGGGLRTPDDAGILALTADEALSLDGQLLVSTRGAGRGAAVDIASDSISIVDERSSSDPSGDEPVVEILASSLAALNAESLLIGGRRSAGADGDVIDVTADLVTIGSGVSLTGSDILLAARDRVTLFSGASVTAAEESIDVSAAVLSGDAGFVRVSADPSAGILRDAGARVTGDVVIEEGALLSSAGSITLDASRNVSSDGILETRGGALRLGAAEIVLGDGPDTGALQLDQSTLAAIDASDIELISRTPIDVFGDVTLDVANNLSIQTPAINAASAGASLSISANRFGLSGTNDNATLAGTAATGQFAVTSNLLDITGGEIAISGFGSSTLSAADSVLFDGSGRLRADGSLDLQAGLFAVAAGADVAIESGGLLALNAVANSESSRSGGPGGRLSLAGEQVTIDAPLRAEAGILNVAASGVGDALSLGSAAQIDLSGTVRDFDGIGVATPGGRLLLDASTGNLRLDSGSSIDVSAPADANAGRVTLRAGSGRLDANGSLRGASANGRGGEFLADAAQLASLDTLLDVVADGAFSNAVSIRQRGTGDLQLNPEQAIVANTIELQADQGGVRVLGSLDLRGKDAELNVNARDLVTLQGSVVAIDENSRLQLSSSNGGVMLEGTASVDLGETGELWIDVNSDVLNALLDANPDNDVVSLDGRIDGGQRIVVEGSQRYVEDDGSVGFDNVLADASNPWFSDAESFMAQRDSLTAALGLAVDDRFSLRPGIVVESADDLVVSSDLNLIDWRFEGEPGSLTLRAAGDLLINASISDGFDSGLLTNTEDTWNYRLIGGADLAAASPLSVVGSADAGNVSIGRREVVRTGNGSIEVSAAGDFILNDQTSRLYTSGVATDGIFLDGRGDLGDRTYPDNGGDIDIRAGRNIIGAETDQLFTAWLWRAGRAADSSSPLATGWTVNFAEFEQNVAALGGGNVDVYAANDILDFSASVPSIGRQIGGTAPEDSVVEVVAGGDLSVEAGGDILGGTYMVGLGDAELVAGNRFGAVDEGLAPIVGLGDGSISILSRQDLLLQAAVNPTLIPQAPQQRVAQSRRSIFSTYAAESALALTSIAGDLATVDVAGALNAQIVDNQFGVGLQNSDVLSLYLVPPSLRAIAVTGDLAIRGSLTMFPSPVGQLELLAGNNLTVGTVEDVAELILSDVDPDVFLTLENPSQNFVGALEQLFAQITAVLPEFNATIPVHANDDLPVRLVAREGNIEMVGPSITSRPVLWSAKPVRLTAGQDIINVNLFAQNLGADSVTSLSAGQDIIYRSDRDAQGRLALSGREIEVSGPGLVVLRAGRDIDLQTSQGISTSGNLRNLALANEGASISALAGLGGREADYDGFVNEYLVARDDYDDALSTFLENVSVPPSADKSAALEQFQGLDELLQQSFVEAVFFNELRASGREAADAGDTNGDFSRGFAALEQLFPGANPDIDAGEVNSYDGDLSLFFSRIYTLDGGNIQLLVPGGDINAGLASPPSAFGLIKTPEQLGIVAQSSGDVSGFAFGDFAVNESRVFAADGGNILIWSTRGDIDAGRGAKTAISAPPPVINIDPETGTTELVFPAALTGSGIQTLATSEGREPGNVDLFAPRGVVNAGDAGIVAGNLTVAAVAVLGADNIEVSGVSIGVPVDTAIAPGLANVSAVASSAAQTAQATVANNNSDDNDNAPLADEALGWLDVFVLGFGDCNPQTGENCED